MKPGPAHPRSESEAPPQSATRAALTPEDQAALKLDTVPPPAGGDAYAADTAIFDAPPEMLEKLREVSSAAAKEGARLAAEGGGEAPRLEAPSEPRARSAPTAGIMPEQAVEDEDENAQTMFFMRLRQSEGAPPSIRELGSAQALDPSRADNDADDVPVAPYVSPLGTPRVAPDRSALIVAVAGVVAAIVAALAHN